MKRWRVKLEIYCFHFNARTRPRTCLYRIMVGEGRGFYCWNQVLFLIKWLGQVWNEYEKVYFAKKRPSGTEWFYSVFLMRILSKLLS